MSDLPWSAGYLKNKFRKLSIQKGVLVMMSFSIMIKGVSVGFEAPNPKK
jgi:hypothetical protein